MDDGSSFAARAGENKQASDEDAEPDDGPEPAGFENSDNGAWTHARAHTTIHNHTLHVLILCQLAGHFLIS
jgi:hypothetical protein